MTGYTVHTGSNDKFRDGWDRIFQTKSTAKSKKNKAAAKAGKDAGSKAKARKK